MDMQLNVNKLKSLRESKAWTQSHLAEVADISLRTIQRIEKSGVASQESTQAICSAYEINVEMLLENKELPKNEQSVEVKSKKNNVKYKLLNPAILTLAMSVAFKFDSDNIVWLWQEMPILGISFGVVSVMLWSKLIYDYINS